MSSFKVDAVAKMEAYEKVYELLPEGSVSITITDTEVIGRAASGAVASVPVTTTSSSAFPGDAIHRMHNEYNEFVMATTKAEFTEIVGSEPDALYMNGTQIVIVFSAENGRSVVGTYDLETGAITINKS